MWDPMWIHSENNWSELKTVFKYICFLFCSTMHCQIINLCSVLKPASMNCVKVQLAMLSVCNRPRYPAISCNRPRYTAISCNRPRYPAISCNRPRYPAISCNNPRYPAISCNRLDIPVRLCYQTIFLYIPYCTACQFVSLVDILLLQLINTCCHVYQA